MSLALPPGILAQAQAAHEANLPDECRIDAPTGQTWDDRVRATVEEWTPLHMGLPCRLPVPSAQGRVIVTGETVTPIAVIVRVPIGAHGIREGMRVTITKARDPELVGTILWVTHNRLRSLGTARYLECREVR